jgi:hypothetical protein
LWVHFLLVLRVEGRSAAQHLEDEDAEAVPIYSSVVAFAKQDLWGHVLGRPAHGVGQRASAELAEPEIGELDVTSGVDENVLRFEVS